MRQVPAACAPPQGQANALYIASSIAQVLADLPDSVDKIEVKALTTPERLLGLLSAFEVVVWMTDGWPLYESRLKGELHVISKRYTQRIERHNLNLRQHLARLGRKSLSFSKSVELHDKVIGHYLNIKHYQ